MGRINLGRVLIGGLLTGLLLNVGEWVLNGIILHADMQEFFRRCGFPQPGTMDPVRQSEFPGGKP